MNDSLKNRPRLGRGLKGMISVAAHTPTHTATHIHPHPAATPGGTIQEGWLSSLREVPLNLITANPHQPRENIDPIALNELMASIKAVGVLQPILLRPDPTHPGHFQLVAGHRRTEAARKAGLTSIPAIVRADSTEENQAEWALIENIQRQDLNPLERAKAYKAYLEGFKLTHTQAAERLGEDRTVISNYLRILDLSEGVQYLIASNLLTAGHAKVLAGLTDRATQDKLAHQCVGEGLSVRRLEELVAGLNNPAPTVAEQVGGGVTEVAAHTRHLTARSPHILELESELSHKLGTKIRIAPARRKNTGKIVIHYYSIDDFDRIVERLEPKGK